MSQRLLVIFAGAVSCLLLVAAAAAKEAVETDPEKVSTSQLLFGQKQLQEHLDGMREYLATLKQRIQMLDEDLLSGQARLFATKQKLEKALAPSRELDELLAEIERLQGESNQLETDIVDAKKRLKMLDQQIADQKLANAELDQARIAARDQVAALEARLDLITSTIKDSIRLRALQLLDEDAPID